MSAIDAVVREVGSSITRDGTAGDLVGGVPAALVTTPRDVAEVSRALGAAAREGLAVVPAGSRTKIDWGNAPRRLDAIVETTALTAIPEFIPGDLVVRAEAGVRLRDLQTILAREGLRLAIDEPVPGSTVGGIVATAIAGPLRYSMGAVRDLVIGATVVRADGGVARAGGKVVKNVAGYDLGKLYTGSYGTLGIVAEATFRLHPLPAATVYVTATYPDHRDLVVPLAALLASQAMPAAIEVSQPSSASPITLCVLVEGSAAGTDPRAERIAGVLGASAAAHTVGPDWWGHLPGDATIRMTTQIAGVPRVLTTVERVSGEAGVPVNIRGSAGSGILYAGFDAASEPTAASHLLDEIRRACAAEGGFATLLRAPTQIRAALDGWGPVPGVSLMRKVKNAFDPTGTMSPGRFVGGI